MTKTPYLTFQINRMLLSEEEKKRMLADLDRLSEAKVDQLAELLEKHDDATLKILNEKAAEQIESKGRIFQEGRMIPGQIYAKQQMVDTFAKLKEVFSDPKKMAKFLRYADDIILVELEQVFDRVLEKKHPETHKCFKQFFREVRLLKIASTKEEQELEKEALIKKILRMNEQNTQLQAAIAQAKKVIGQNHDKNSKGLREAA